MRQSIHTYVLTDRPMWLNSGRFLDNGRSGYVLKPLVMTSGTFNPFRHETYSGIVDGVTLRIRVRFGG